MEKEEGNEEKEGERELRKEENNLSTIKLCGHYLEVHYNEI